MTNATLRQILENLERKWVEVLHAKFAAEALWPEIATGHVQFFSVDFPKPQQLGDAIRTADVREQLSVAPLLIVCAGLNYKAYPRTGGLKGVPHIYSQTDGLTWVVDDPKKSRATRRALNSALSGYIANRQEWVRHGYASAATLLLEARETGLSQHPMILLKTYLSPFLLGKPWLTHSRSLQTATLRAWNPKDHICDFIKEIGTNVDLWVIEGTSLWAHFDTTSPHISRWLLTPTLSFESLRNETIMTFWKTKRRDHATRSPRFSSC